jgi:hydrogenase expression/formation protein HypD
MVPVVVTGFEPVDILEGILQAVKLLESADYTVENAYKRAVTYNGNIPAQSAISKVFKLCDRKWRGIGLIPMSGWCLRQEFSDFDAEIRFDVAQIKSQESSNCISGSVLQGLKKPNECPVFGTDCTPERPLGATMVSSEGACAAYYRYRLDDDSWQKTQEASLVSGNLDNRSF